MNLKSLAFLVFMPITPHSATTPRGVVGRILPLYLPVFLPQVNAQKSNSWALAELQIYNA